MRRPAVFLPAVLTAVLPLCAPPCSAVGLLFDARVDYLVGHAPELVIAEDLDGDGDLDIAVAKDGMDMGISVLINTGDGRFASPVSYAFGYLQHPTSICASDINGDNHVDLVVALNDYYGKDLSVLLNEGNGTFEDPLHYDFGSMRPSGLAAADFNGDGHNDLVFAGGHYSEQVYVLLNQGDATFLTDTDYTVGSSPVSVSTADFDKDGHRDIVAACSWTDSIYLLMNRGDGKFHSSVSYAVGTAPISAVSCDLDHDGFADVATSNWNGRSVSVLLNRGDGTLRRSNNYPICIHPAHPGPLCSADVDNDGYPDLVVANTDSASIAVLRNAGDGTFESSVNYGPAGTGKPHSICSGDLDDDGDVDLAVGSSQGKNFSIFTNNGSGGFAVPPKYLAGSRPLSMTSNDFDQDEDVDLAVANTLSDNISIFFSNGDGSFQPAQNFPGGTTPRAITTADYDGDGDYDIAVANLYANAVSIHANLGSGSFELASQCIVGVGPVAIISADFNGDSSADLAVGNWGSEDISILINNGNGIFDSAITLNFGGVPWSLHTSDLDGDEDLDLSAAGVVGNYGSLYVFFNVGGGIFQPRVRVSAGDWKRPDHVFGADLDADSDNDLVVTSFADEVIVLLNDGNGSFAPGDCYATDFLPKAIQIADLNLDGHLDIAVANDAGSNVQVLLGNGDGSFVVDHFYGTGSGAIAICTADFDDDGDIDLATANTDGYAYVLLNQVDTTITDTSESPATRPDRFFLLQNYPNPFNLETTIKYSLAEPTWVNLAVYNILGQRICVLADGFKTKGRKSVSWDGRSASGEGVASGIYFYQLRAGTFSETKKLVLLK